VAVMNKVWHSVIQKRGEQSKDKGPWEDFVKGGKKTLETFK
jgi:hypothetical protein